MTAKSREPHLVPPDLVIAGAYRSGTTSLRRLLARHDDIYFPSLAEPSYFAFDEGRYPPHLLAPGSDPFHRRRTRRRDDYDELFAGAEAHQLRADCSPEYLREPESLRRLATARPDARVIVTLRHPVDRVISDWQMCRRDGVEPLDLDAALDAIAGRALAGAFGAHYLDTSRYSSQLPLLIDTFPESQRLVLIQEQWTKDPTGTLRSIAEFLGVGASGFGQVDAAARHNMSGEPASVAVELAFRARRRLAPILAGRVPAPLQQFADRQLRRGLIRRDHDAARARIASLLDGEVAAVERLLDRPIPEWER